MNGTDLLIILVFVGAATWGGRRGIHAGLMDLSCIVGGLAVGMVGYPAGWWLLRKGLKMPDLLSGLLGFVLMVAIGATAAGFAVSRLVKVPEKPSRASRVAGGILNALLAYLVLGIFLQFMTAAPRPREQISNSTLAGPLLAIVPLALHAAELPGIDLPRVVAVPRSFEGDFELNAQRYPTFRPINFTKLAGSTCIKCGGKIEFLGYYFKGGGPLPSPKFQCRDCGRTTDGCQAFESFHKMYHECPITLAERGSRLDCGVWNNDDYVLPRGQCPVCGKEYTPPSRSRRRQ